MNIDSHQLALGVGIFSVSFAVMTLGQMIVLLIRRKKLERSSRHADQYMREIARAILPAISGGGGNVDMFRAAGRAVQIKAIAHLLQLVRGDERGRLLVFAEEEKICAGSIKRLKHRNPARRVDAMRVLEQVPVKSAVSAVEKIMRDDGDMAVRLEAAATLARIGFLPDPLAVIHALDLVNRPLTRLHEALFRSVAQRDSRELARIAAMPEYAHARPILVEALGWSQDLSIVKSLSHFAEDEDFEVRCAVLKAARRLEHPASGEWAARLLLDPEDQVRVQAIQTCGKLGVRNAIPILLTLLENKSWWVRARAREALELLRPAQPLRQDLTGVRQ